MAVTIERNDHKKGKRILITIGVIFALLIGATCVCLQDTSGVNPPDGTSYIELAEGQTSKDIANMLHEQNIIKYPLIFRIQAKLGGYDGHFQPGSANIEAGMTYSDILDMLITPSRNTTKVVVPKGCDVKELEQLLSEAGLINSDEFYAALANPSDYNYAFLKQLPTRDNTLDGYLYPATYEIPQGMSAHDIVDLMLSTLDAKLSPQDYEAAQNLGMTIDQIITLASLVERDTTDGSDLNRTAAVYINRARCAMPLESKGSIQFILGDRKPVLSIADTKIQSPYNTFLNAGLPIGPICNPGAEAINAVLSYNGTDDYYYALAHDGTQIFASDYDSFQSEIAGKELMVDLDSDTLANIDDKIGNFGAIAQIPIPEPIVTETNTDNSQEQAQ